MSKSLHRLSFAAAMLGLAFSSFSLGSAGAQPLAVDLVLHNARLVDVASGQVAQDQALAIDKVRIVAVVPDEGADQAYRGTKTLDVAGQWVMPGLWDNHIHFGGAGLEEENADLLPLFVLNGVTAVRDAAGDLAQTVLDWRANSPREVAPRIFTSGPKIEGIAPIWKGVIEAGSKAQVNAALDRLQGLGVDFVKITDNTLTPELFLYTVAEAKTRGIKTSGHIPMELTVLQAAEAGLSTIEHLNYLMKAGSREEAQISADYIAKKITYAEAMARYARTFDEEVALRAYRRLAELGVMASPTQHGSSLITRLDVADHSSDPELAYVGAGIVATYDWRVERSKQATPQMVEDRYLVEAVTLKTLPLLRQAGVKILAGTDAGYLNSYNYPGFSLHDELDLYVHNGLSPREALAASVINGPELMGVSADYGALAPGKVADLIVLKANPLLDIAATRQIEAVVTKGQVLDADALSLLATDIRAKVAETKADQAR